MELENAQQYLSKNIAEALGLFDKNRMKHPMRWQEYNVAGTRGPNQEFEVVISSHGSVIDAKQAFLEAKVTLDKEITATQLVKFMHSLQFIQGVNVRIGNCNAILRPHQTQYLTMMDQECLEDFADRICYKTTVQEDSEEEKKADVGTRLLNQFRQTLSRIGTGALDFLVQIPLLLSHPELNFKGQGGLIYIDQQSSVRLQYRVGLNPFVQFVGGGTEVAPQVSQISDIRFIYTETYPVEAQLSVVKASTFPIYYRHYDYRSLPASGQTNFAFNWNIHKHQHLKKILIAMVPGIGNVSDARAITVTLPKLYIDLQHLITTDNGADPPVVDGVSAQGKINSSLAPFTLTQLDVNYPGFGKASINSAGVLGVIGKPQKNRRDPHSVYFRYFTEISLEDLPYEQIDESLVYGPEVDNPQQLTINVRIATGAGVTQSQTLMQSAEAVGTYAGYEFTACLVSDYGIKLQNGRYVNM